MKEEHMFGFKHISSTLIVAGLVASTASAQFNNAWVTFVKDTNRIQNPDGSVATHITTDTEEKDYAWGDVNNDGWTDVVVVRKNGWSQLPNKRVGYLMMNEYGKLVDRTAQYASDSDLPGDFGLMTPTAAREVALIDINNDGWLDMITAATNLTAGDPKSLTHPRVFRNKGVVNGVWQGFRHEDGRFPQLYPIGSTTPVGPRICGLAVGDVNGDGFADMYYADYDETEPGPVSIPENPAHDTNDRLLINDGAGNFVDSLETRMTTEMLFSTFGTHALIRDINGDGFPDIVKNTALNAATYDSVSYQNPLNPGTFNLFQKVTSATATPYHFDVADLNQDGRPDLVVGDDGQDHIKYNTGTDALGRATWSSNINWSYLSGSSDGGFPGTTVVADLNNDGWPDIVQSDVDVDLIGCNRMLKIMHNPGGVVGSNIVPRLEAQQSGSGGWKGAVGMLVSDLQGTWDCAVFDIDNDGDLDIVQGRCVGTTVWINQLNSAPTVTAYCFGDGTGTACPCANHSAVGDNEGCLNSFGNGARLSMSGSARVSADTFKMNGSRMPNSGPCLYFQGSTQMSAGNGIAFGDGKLCLTGTIIRLGVKFNTATGTSSYPVGADTKLSIAGVVNPGDTRTYQVWYRDAAAFCTAATYNLSNGVQAVWAP
ncbi:MAG: VCBS repeat-containing protein [Planctomycetes bacterium]|nr:VCBS repeat-containing protein [Planctomycetota bacterium]